MFDDLDLDLPQLKKKQLINYLNNTSKFVLKSSFNNDFAFAINKFSQFSLNLSPIVFASDSDPLRHRRYRKTVRKVLPDRTTPQVKNLLYN